MMGQDLPQTVSNPRDQGGLLAPGEGGRGPGLRNRIPLLYPPTPGAKPGRSSPGEQAGSPARACLKVPTWCHGVSRSRGC